MEIAFLILISTVCIVGTEIITRKFRLPTAYTRRFIHIGTALVAGLAPLYATRDQLILVCVIFIIMLLVGRSYKLFSAIHTTDRKSFGDIYLPLGVILSALIFLPHDTQAFQFGILIMGISDAVAGFIGEKFGKHTIKVYNNKKSMEGSFAFFICSFLLTVAFFPFIGYEIFIIPIILMMTELGLVHGFDNLVLPIIAAFLAKLLF